MSRRDLVRKASKADLKNAGNEPTDGNIAAAKRAKANVQQWSMQQLMFWLESNKMKWLKPIYKEGDDSVKKYIREDTKMFQKRQDKNNEVLLKGGPAENMIAFTTLPEDATLRVIWSEGDDYLADFLMTFYGFSTPAQFLEVLKSRYTFVAKAEPDSDGEDDDDEGPAEVQTTVNVLKAWIDAEQGIDFDLDETLAKKFDEAVDTFSKEHSKELKKHLKKTLKEKGEKKKPEKRKDVEIPAPILPKKKEFTLLELDPIELARQLTLIDERLYSQIRPKEFLKQAWAKKDHETRAPNLSRFSQHSNRIINWITTEILKLPDAESRAELIQNFIKCAKQLSQLQNFNGVMEVLSSLHSSSVSRLQQTWDLVPSKLKDIFEELTTMMSSQKNFKTYREMLTNIDSSTPCIPFLAMFLSDCIYLDDCLPDMLEDLPEFVNWDKWKTFATKIRDMKRFTAKYPLKGVDYIQEFITQAEYWDDDKEMFRISQLRENKDQAGLQNAMQQSGKPGKEKKGGAGGNINLKSMYLGAVSAQMNELSDREWQILLTGAVLKKYAPGAIVLDIGLTNRHLYRIKAGTVRVDKEINGERITVDKMGQDAMFGEVSMLLRQQQGTTTAAIVADTEVELWELEVEFVLKLCESEPALSEKLHRILAVKLARRLKNLGSKPKSNDAKPTPQETQVKRLLTSSPSSATLKASVSVATLEQEVKKEDEKFIKLFKLPSTEIVLKDFRCEMKPSKVGTLYVSPNYVCFYSSVIGLKTKEVFPFSKIKSIKKDEKQIEISYEKLYIFRSFENSLDEVYDFLINIYEQLKQRTKEEAPQIAPSKESRRNLSVSAVSDAEAKQAKNRFMLTEEDRALILKGAKCVTYQKDDAVINQGDQFQRIFQLSRGSCRIEKMDDSGQRMVLGRMVPDDGAVFGEISFLEGGAASASVIADENDTQVFVIEGYFLNVLFEKYPSMGGRFYHFLAQMLSKRLKQRESEQQPGGAKEKSKEKKKKRGSAQPGSKSGEKHAELSEQNESGTENTSTAEQSN